MTGLGFVERKRSRFLAVVASQALKRFEVDTDTAAAKAKGIDWVKEIKMFCGSILAMAAVSAFMNPHLVWEPEEPGEVTDVAKEVFMINE